MELSPMFRPVLHNDGEGEEGEATKNGHEQDHDHGHDHKQIMIRAAHGRKD